jgi:hypothetical protein
LGAPTIFITTGSWFSVADRPLLVSDGRQYHLSWTAKAEGYRLQSIEGER